MIQSIPNPCIHAFTIDFIRDEARQLINRGVISRNQPLYCLCHYVPAREWADVESELERNDYLLRDRVGDLLSYEEWSND